MPDDRKGTFLEHPKRVLLGVTVVAFFGAAIPGIGTASALLFAGLLVWWVFVAVRALVRFATDTSATPNQSRTEIKPRGSLPRSPETPTPATPRTYNPSPSPARQRTDGVPTPRPSPTERQFFAYAGTARSPGSWSVHGGPFAVVDVETTGFSPGRGDRVIEIAIARVSADGRIEDEYATLINPEGRPTGAVWIHGITDEAVRTAPLFADVAGEVLARLDGAVVVAHNAEFEERFLTAEFTRCEIGTPMLPALCSLWLGRRTISAPNHKLATLASHCGVPLMDAHAALGDVRAVAGLLPLMLGNSQQELWCDQPAGSNLSRGFTLGITRPRTRAVELRKGTDGWMSSLLTRLPLSSADADDSTTVAYLDALATVLADGKITGVEAKMLAHMAGEAGLGAKQVSGLNERFLESMREAAFADEILTTQELRQLRAAANALGVEGYFDDLVASPPVTIGYPRTSPQANGARRCGHCREVGHYRPSCPDLS